MTAPIPPSPVGGVSMPTYEITIVAQGTLRVEAGNRQDAREEARGQDLMEHLEAPKVIAVERIQD